MASSAETPFVVVTQVYPQQSGPAASASCTTQHISPVLQKFLKGEPKALGTLQIMIGVLDILFGIALSFYGERTVVNGSGIFFWGGLIYISSGALSIAANNKLNHCLVRGALVMNIISTITAGIVIILFSLDFILPPEPYSCHGNKESDSYYSCKRMKHTLEARSYGISGVMLVFTVLEFIISICVSAFACEAVCASSPVQVVYMAPANSQVASPNPLISAPNTYEMPSAPILGQDVTGSTQTEKPPRYDELP